MAGAEASPLGPEAHGKGFRFCSKGSGQPLWGGGGVVKAGSELPVTQVDNSEAE